MDPPAILVIDDEPHICLLVRETLRQHGMAVRTASDGRQALRALDDGDPDLILLDVGLPDIDGFSLCSRIRERSHAPIIMLTARHHDEDVVRGFQAGADDYVIKPFSPRQLAARAEALLRRARGPSAPVGRYRDERLNLDVASRRGTLDGKEARLTPSEAKLLDLVLAHPRRVFSPQELLRHLRGPGYEDAHGALRQVILGLRRKIEPDPSVPVYLITAPGGGYAFEPRAETSGS
jgi:two-component system, OmpR family, KDP operon response regulator KdpE